MGYIRTAADRIAAVLQADTGANRPIIEGALVLAFLCEWHQRRLPMPRRTQVAQWLGCSTSCLDTTLSRQLLLGHLKIEIEIIQGNNRSQKTGIQQVHYVPSDELLGAYFGQRLWPEAARRA